MCTLTLPDDDAAWQAKSPAALRSDTSSAYNSSAPFVPLAGVIPRLLRHVARSTRRRTASIRSRLVENPPSGFRRGCESRDAPAPSVCDIALAYLAAGRSVVPIAPGRKVPSLVNPHTGKPYRLSWKHYQRTLATPDEARDWFSSQQPLGIGIVAGPVSGMTLPDGTRAGLEFLDFDDPDTHACFVERLTLQGYGGLLERLPCDASPRGGHHYGYLCVEWAGSTPLARRRIGMGKRGRAKIKKLIERKGRGGQCVVAPTPPGIHPDHPERGYAVVRGDWTRPPLITPEERRVLQACARALDEDPPRPAAHPTPTRHARRLAPPPLTLAEQGERVSAYALTRSPSGEDMAGEGEGLRALLRAPDIALACAAALGLPTDRVGQGFRCILPGHAEAHPSASLHWDPKTGALMYRDWHARDSVEWYTLPDVRASLACGQAVRLRGPSVATWQLQLLVEMKILDPYPVTGGPLPPGVRPAVRKVYEGFEFLLACKWWHTP
jgi:hypothetical protein